MTENWIIDAEWGFSQGHTNDHGDFVPKISSWSPVVFCAVGFHSGRRLHFWGRDPQLLQFFHNHSTDLFVSHYFPAEMSYLLRLGIPLPAHGFCTYTGWRRLSNSSERIGASLLTMLQALGCTHRLPEYKSELQQKILQLNFDPSNPADRTEIINYCFEDCDDCGIAYHKIADQIDPVAMNYWCNYHKAISKMEIRGIPIDYHTASLILRSRWAITDYLIVQVNKTWPVYVDGSFNRKSFLAWCTRQNIVWPSKRSDVTGRLYRSFDDETLKDMEALNPFIASVRQTRKTINAFKRRVSISIDGTTKRHYFSTSPFVSITGRNQPRNFLFAQPKWMRWLVIPPGPDTVLVYVDYSSQEIAIAAALSSDPAMRKMYVSNDAHMWFAIQAGAAPPGATKQTHRTIRNLYKRISLGVLYGLTGYGAAYRLQISLEQAQAIIDQHRDLFTVYWDWSERMVQNAFDRGIILTKCGWGCKVPQDSNPRTWRNWPIQSTGADIMRLTAIYLDQMGVQLLATIHDGFLMVCKRNELDDLISAVNKACAMAVQQVLSDFPLRWDIHTYGRRFEDEDGEPLWRLLVSALKELYPNHARYFE